MFEANLPIKSRHSQSTLKFWSLFKIENQLAKSFRSKRNRKTACDILFYSPLFFVENMIVLWHGCAAEARIANTGARIFRLFVNVFSRRHAERKFGDFSLLLSQAGRACVRTCEIREPRARFFARRCFSVLLSAKRTILFDLD